MNDENLKDYCLGLKEDYVLLLDKFGLCQPYDVNQQIYLSWEYLWLQSKLKIKFEAFKAYTQKALSVCVTTLFAPNTTKIVTFNKTSYLNTYKRYQISHPDALECDLFHLFMKRLFPLANERETVLKWLAFAIQCPEQRPTWHLLLTGETGVGKGVLFSDVINPLVSGQTKLVNKFSRLTGQFSSVLEDSLFLCLDDCRYGTIDTQTQLKSLLTEKNVFVEKKGLNDAGMVNTYTRIVLNSNNKIPLPIESSDRRWFAPSFITHTIDGNETQRFMESFIDWIQQKENLDRVYNYLASIDLKDFNPNRCIQTPTLLTMIENSAPTLEAEIQSFIDNGNELFQRHDLMEYLDTRRVKYNNETIANALQELDYTCPRVTIKGKKHTIYMPSGYNRKLITVWPVPPYF